MKTWSGLPKSLALHVMIAVFAITTPAVAKTKRNAVVVIQNRTGAPILGLNITHKYSDDYKETYKFNLIKSGADTKPKSVSFNTGAFTTGQDWWALSWAHLDNNSTVYFSDPSNYRRMFDSLEKKIISGLHSKQLADATRDAVEAACKLKYNAAACSQAGKLASQIAMIEADIISRALFNESGTEGFKKHLLRKSDANGVVYITIKGNNDITIRSPSGTSNTVYSFRTVKK